MAVDDTNPLDPADPRMCPKPWFRLRETLLLPLATLSCRPAAPGPPLAAPWRPTVPPNGVPPERGGGYPKNDEKIKVLRMKFSIVEILSGLQESIFSLFRRPQLHSREKSKK